jgi:cytosine deaminase
MPSDFLSIPPSLTSFRLANARVPVCLAADATRLIADAEGLASCDIVIEKDRIAAIDPPAPAHDGLRRFDLDQGIVLPRLVDVHTHIDKGEELVTR